MILLKLVLLIKKIIVSALLIYSFNFFLVSLNFFIPINLITVVLVSLFDFSAIFYLFLFYLIFY